MFSILSRSRYHPRRLAVWPVDIGPLVRFLSPRPAATAVGSLTIRTISAHIGRLRSIAHLAVAGRWIAFGPRSAPRVLTGVGVAAARRILLRFVGGITRRNGIADLWLPHQGGACRLDGFWFALYWRIGQLIRRFVVASRVGLFGGHLLSPFSVLTRHPACCEGCGGRERFSSSAGV